MGGDASRIVREILSIPKFGDGIGFHRLESRLGPLLDSDWGRRFSTIRVTGSNGKGSVTAMTHAILRALGVACGRFTSPHLIRFHERIVIGDEEVTDEALERAFSWLEGPGGRLREQGFGSFEVVTALGVRSFFEAGVDLAVVEAGIGGRYDPTRMLPGRLVGLTSIDLEHAELLGGTKELIAYDKLDLCPEGGTVVAACRDPGLWPRIRAYGRLRRLALVDAREHCHVECSDAVLDQPDRGMRVRIRSPRVSCEALVPLVGTHQLENIAVAVSLVETWAGVHRPDLSASDLSSAVATGLGRVRWPGRFECIATAPAVYIDVGHSPDACARLAESVRTFLGGRRILLVTGVSANKAVREILEVLLPLGEAVIATRAHHNGERVDRIVDLARQIRPDGKVRRAETVEEAAGLARRIAETEDMVVLVAGGLFLATEFKVAWEGGDPRALAFL